MAKPASDSGATDISKEKDKDAKEREKPKIKKEKDLSRWIAILILFYQVYCKITYQQSFYQLTINHLSMFFLSQRFLEIMLLKKLQVLFIVKKCLKRTAGTCSNTGQMPRKKVLAVVIENCLRISCILKNVGK